MRADPPILPRYKRGRNLQLRTVPELSARLHGKMERDAECALPTDRQIQPGIEMNLVRQINPTTCGQACIAMIHGIGIETAIAYVGHTGEMSDVEILVASGTDAPMRDGPPASDVTAIQKHRDPKGDREHWTVSHNRQTLDPAEIGKKLWPVTKHVVIDWIH